MERLQRYDLLERIAIGGMGEVFVADVSGAHGFQKRVAVKRILPALASDPAFVDRFVNEAKISVSLSHANLVQVLDLGRAGNELFLAMEYVEGSDLARLVKALSSSTERTPVGFALHVAIEALKGLSYAHDRVDLEGHPRGIVHCDISPSNLIVSYAGEVKIADFGVAQLLSLARRRGADGHVVGKFQYMAPEMLRSEPLDARTDLYSLAVVIWELLALKRAFDGDSEDAIVRDVLAGRLPRLAALRNDVPRPLDDMLARTMSLDPASRPTSARALLAELTEVAHTLRPVVTAPEVGQWVRRCVPPRQIGTSNGFDRALHGLVGAGARQRTVSVAPDPANRPEAMAAAPLGSSTFVVRAARDGTTIWEPARVRSFARRRKRRLFGALAALLVAATAGVIAIGWRSDAAPRGAIPRMIASEPAIQLPAHVPVAPPSPMAIASPPEATPPTVSPPPSIRIPVHQKREHHADGQAPTVRARSTRPSPGYVNINAEPWATVFVDGKRISATPIPKLPMAPGAHRVRFEKPGFRTVEKLVRVREAETQLLDVDMQP